ncbi:MAG: FAD-binding oxidoreductase [Alphaproteobacteria bacterium]|nr:FAD-binding oxidoreductase [Alphaproteobacteria bacterium]
MILPAPGPAESWGRVVRASSRRLAPQFRDEVARGLAAARDAGVSTLGVGLGRSYGDSGLNSDQAVIDARHLDRLISFDPDAGVLRAEAGASLGALAQVLAPRGFFLPTVPGTRFVTLGGAVANDVHGKNHERAGTFGANVRRIGLRRSDGVVEIAPGDDLFAATIGGLGLTGFIEWVEIGVTRIPSTLIDQETIPFDDLDAFFAIAAESKARFEHTVAWVDCTQGGKSIGRGVFTRGVWAPDGGFAPHTDRALPVPIEAPSFALNPLTLKAFNVAYDAAQRLKAGTARVHYTGHFWPLDSLFGWNKLYGPKGFYQYQCVLPWATGRDGVAEMLRRIARSGEGSFLAVLKTFGDRPSPGMLSFPMPGTTLALDFRNRGAATMKLLAALDDIVREAGGRLYPAKDGRMPAAMFRAGYPALDRFATFVDPAFSSDFWRRITA